MDDPRPTSDEGGTDDPGTPMDPEVQGQLSASGAAHASHDVAGVAGAQAEGRATSELAADARVRELRRFTDGRLSYTITEEELDALVDRVALVARVTDLEAQVASLTDDLERAMTAAEQAIERGNTAATGWQATKEQVAALTQEVIDADTHAGEWVQRAEAAEAALAEARQALAARDVQLGRLLATLDYMGGAELVVADIRRALADTEEQT